MRWSSQAGATAICRRAHCLFVMVVLLSGFLLLPQPAAQTEAQRQLTVYAAQTGYSLPLVTRDGRDYIGLVEILEPLGSVSAVLEGKKWKLRFAGREAQFTIDGVKARIQKDEIELDGPFFVENGRGLVPVHTLPLILAELIPSRAFNFHEQARRLFLDKVAVRYGAEIKQAGQTRLVISFSAPVNPFIATEAGKLHMTFQREPLVSREPGTPATFNDALISSLTFSEGNGAAVLTVNGPGAFTASFSPDRKSITIAPVATMATSTPAQSPPATAPALTGNNTAPGLAVSPNAPSQPSPTLPQPRPFLVVIDAAHGGDDRGDAIGEKMAEKDLTLALARRLNTELQMRGIASRLTREGDTTLSLEQRTAAANSAVPSVYLSVHAAATGSGVHVFTSNLPAAQRAAFLSWNSAQAAYVDLSRAIATALATELLKRDIPAVDISAPVAGLNAIAAPALAVEVAAPPKSGMSGLGSVQYQQTISNSVAVVIAGMRSRIPHGEPAR